MIFYLFHSRHCQQFWKNKNTPGTGPNARYSIYFAAATASNFVEIKVHPVPVQMCDILLISLWLPPAIL
jgi:hypothetical protein